MPWEKIGSGQWEVYQQKSGGDGGEAGCVVVLFIIAILAFLSSLIG